MKIKGAYTIDVSLSILIEDAFNKQSGLDIKECIIKDMENDRTQFADMLVANTPQDSLPMSGYVLRDVVDSLSRDELCSLLQVVALPGQLGTVYLEEADSVSIGVDIVVDLDKLKDILDKKTVDSASVVKLVGIEWEVDREEVIDCFLDMDYQKASEILGLPSRHYANMTTSERLDEIFDYCDSHSIQEILWDLNDVPMEITLPSSIDYSDAYAIREWLEEEYGFYAEGWYYECGDNVELKGVISKDLIREGFETGDIAIIDCEEADTDGAVCKIGEDWLFFGGAEEFTAEEYLKTVPTEEIIDEVYDALEGLRQGRVFTKDDYLYFASYLRERLCFEDRCLEDETEISEPEQ